MTKRHEEWFLKAEGELDFQKWATVLTVIDGYYVTLRYPDAAAGSKAGGPPNQEEAGEALTTAEEIFEHVKKNVHSGDD